jgi:hypothetical protein
LIHLILSLDHELFGNGSGDVRRDMIEPTRRLLALCDRHGAKITIFCEVGEYWAMQEAEEAGSLQVGYSPSGEIAEQIQYAAAHGHDVQLHLHPWWIGAVFRDGGWRLHPEYKRISDLPNGLGSEGDLFSIVGALHKGKCTLEAMIRPIRGDYECLVYRAAMFWGQPSKDLIQGLRKAGLMADSSVISGLHEVAPVLTDYRGAPSAAGCWWTSADDIGQAGPKGEGIIEFPVYSRLRPYVCNFKWTKLCTTVKRRLVERANTGGHGMMAARRSSDSLAQVLRKLGSRQPLKYDFCKLSAGDMIRGLRRAIRDDWTAGEDLGTPVVMLGHSKDFWNDSHVETFLRFVQEECAASVRFSTLGELTTRILERDAPLKGDGVRFGRCR